MSADSTERKFAGKRAVVTGGDRGIGLGIAQALAAGGAEVCLVARDQEALQAESQALQTAGHTCHALSFDLATVAGAQDAAAAILELADRWDILVNNAGNPPGPPLLEMDVEFWDTTFGVHCRAPFVLSQALVRGMIAAGGGGNILNISSAASLVGFRNHGAYSSAKAALNMLTREMTLEWSEHNIKVNAICPTVVLTKLGRKVWGENPVLGDWAMGKIPARRFAEVADVVNLAMFLIGPENTFVHGAIIPCDGGMTTGHADGPPSS